MAVFVCCCYYEMW